MCKFLQVSILYLPTTKARIYKVFNVNLTINLRRLNKEILRMKSINLLIICIHIQT